MHLLANMLKIKQIKDTANLVFLMKIIEYGMANAGINADRLFRRNFDGEQAYAKRLKSNERDNEQSQ